MRLDYCVQLGVDALWITPIFGTMNDFDEMLAEVKRRGMKRILDYVPNHTSDRHPWFLDSRSTRDSSKRDWYRGTDAGSGGGPPNNWMSNFGGSACELGRSRWASRATCSSTCCLKSTAARRVAANTTSCSRHKDIAGSASAASAIDWRAPIPLPLIHEATTGVTGSSGRQTSLETIFRASRRQMR